jgi:hypothetical protein
MWATLSYDNASNHTPIDTESHPRKFEPFMEGVPDPLLQIKGTMFHGQDCYHPQTERLVCTYSFGPFS